MHWPSMPEVQATKDSSNPAIEFVPVLQPLNCGFIVEDFALAVLLSPEVFIPSRCKAVIAITCTFLYSNSISDLTKIFPDGGTEVDMRVAGSCTDCQGTNVEISTEGYRVLAAPLGTRIDVAYTIE